MLRLPLDRSYFTDLDGDGSLEELCCTGLYYEADRCYTKFGIYTDLAGSFHYEDVAACDFRPFYVKAKDGNHYIYLFCEENEVGKHVQGQMKLVVYNVNGGILARVGDMNIAPAYIPSDIFVLPLDPDNMFLDNYDSLSQDAELYTVGSNGMPLEKNGTQPVEEAVQVNNVKDFLEAIVPGATITFSPGYYNLSEYTDELWKEEGEEWNRTHPYVKLRECFDGGIEVVVQNVNDISIIGDMESDIITELVVETRYGAVLNFEDCNNIFLSGLTMGHTQAGACDESVLTFSNSSDICLSAMDLYGCGMYGFTAKNGSGNIYVKNSIIRECEAGPFCITESTGRFEFKNCSLTGSFGGGYYEPAEGAELSFTGCSFGTQETNYWYFDESAVFTDCYWEEITEYPDVEPEEGYFDIDSLELMSVNDNEVELADTYYAYMVVDQQSGETVYYPYFTLQLSADGTGYCETENEYFEFVWYLGEDGMLILEGDIYHYLTPYIEHADGYDAVWFMMQMNENVIWIY